VDKAANLEKIFVQSELRLSSLGLAAPRPWAVSWLFLAGTGRAAPGSAGLKCAWLGSAGLGLARLGLAGLGLSPRLATPRLATPHLASPRFSSYRVHWLRLTSPRLASGRLASRRGAKKAKFPRRAPGRPWLTLSRRPSPLSDPGAQPGDSSSAALAKTGGTDAPPWSPLRSKICRTAYPHQSTSSPKAKEPLQPPGIRKS
jgi:hypothetical protein